MSITIEYLENLEFEIVKQKYYNANKVNAKLDELKAGVRELIEENEQLKKGAAAKQSAAALEAENAVISSAQRIANATINDAQAKADRMLSAAQSEAKRILDEARANSTAPAAAPVAGVLSVEQLDAIDDLNNQLDSLNTSHATQIFKLKQQLMNLAIGK